MRSIKLTLFSFLVCCTLSTKALCETKIAVWNVKASLEEKLQQRLQDFSNFEKTIKPDVIILVEMNGERSVRSFVGQLGWNNYSYVTSNLSTLSSSVHSALEVAVISKNPIIEATEFDVSPDGTHFINNQTGKVKLTHEKQLSSEGIDHFGDPLSKRYDRGTLNVVLENGLSIFVVHLKSDRVPLCDEPRKVLNFLKKNKFPLTPELSNQLSNAKIRGYPGATKQRVKNAKVRERVIASVAREAEKEVIKGRTVIIAGDFNTGFEKGKAGKSPDDCELKEFSCKKGPFQPSACNDGDGYDDTLGILENGLVGPTKWSILSKSLGRTYISTDFADKAIDHIAVPKSVSNRFSNIRKLNQAFGSDHYPILVEYK